VLNINLKLELKTTLNLHRTSRVVLSHVLPLVTPRLRSRPPPKYLRTAVAAICGGPSWSSPGKLHPFRPSSLSSYYKKEKRQDRNSITRTQKVVRPDNGPFPGEVTLSLGRTPVVKQRKRRRNCHSPPIVKEGRR
jgi:hypothetical protein